MINAKVFSEKTSIPKFLVALLFVVSFYDCQKKHEQAPQVSFLENKTLIQKFPKSILSVADFLNNWETGQKVSSITEEPETADGKAQYTIDLQSQFDLEKKTTVFADFNKEIIKKYHYLQFILDVPHNKVIVIADTTEMFLEKSKNNR